MRDMTDTLERGPTGAIAPHPTPARHGAPETFAQLFDAYNAASDTYDAALAVQSEADKALFAFKVAHGVGYERAPGYAAIRDACDRAERAANKPCRAHMRALDRLMAFPTLAPAELDFKRKLVAESSAIGSDDPARAFIDATMQALEGMQTTLPDRALVTQWDKSMATYLKAREAVECLSKVEAALDDRVDIPEPLRAPGLHYPIVCRWSELQDLAHDLLVTPARKAELMPILREYLIMSDLRWRPADPRRDALAEAREEAAEILDDALWEAEKRLLDLPAPNAAAMAWKAAMIARESDDDRFGFADFGLIAYHLTDCGYPDRGQTAQFLDLLRLCEPNSPVLRMPSFSPSAWIRAYEAAGGVVSNSPTGLIILFPESDNPEAAALRAELAETPWKYRALALRAENRAFTGGDPFFISGGRYDEDRARGAPRFISPDQPADRALHVVFVTIDGAPVPVVEEIVNDLA